MNLLNDILRLDKPWPLHDILEKLIYATNHLLNDHSCDVHGYEEILAAKIAAEELLTLIKSEEISKELLSEIKNEK